MRWRQVTLARENRTSFTPNLKVTIMSYCQWLFLARSSRWPERKARLATHWLHGAYSKPLSCKKRLMYQRR